jgi:ethanolamine utilization protein EutA
VTQFIHQAYAEAGFAPDDVDTGAVVITGEALKKENARPIAEFFSAESGKFICASAGPNHEAILAAHGCGAVAESKDNNSIVLNVDCGGGTAKFSLIQDGVVTQTAALEVGARLIAFDSDGVVSRLEEPAKSIMPEAGGSVALGERVTEEDKEKFAKMMAKCLFEVILGGPHSPLTQKLLLTPPISGYQNLDHIDRIIFSGGVSEYVYEHDQTAYGDLGPLFGKAIREQLALIKKPDLVHEPLEGIRATVIGAGEYTIQASGTTSYISSTRALPVYALQVVRPALDHDASVQVALKNALAKFDLDQMIDGLAVALVLNGQQNYESLRRLADGLAAVVPSPNGQSAPLFLVLNLDVAKSLGGILKEELGITRDVVAIDGIDVGDLDYIDIGRPVGTSEVLPVTVKSLLFPSEQKKAEEAVARV